MKTKISKKKKKMDTLIKLKDKELKREVQLGIGYDE
jgi:hypothetical protein